MGTPYQIYWNDDKCPKGFHIFDTETRELERVLNPYKIYKKVYYDDTNGKEFNYSQIEDLKDKIVKLVVVNKKDLYEFDRFVDKVLTESMAHDVKIIEDFSDLKAENVKDEIIENAQDTMTLLESYVDELDVNNLDKPRLKSMLKGLYVEASNMEV